MVARNLWMPTNKPTPAHHSFSNLKTDSGKLASDAPMKQQETYGGNRNLPDLTVHSHTSAKAEYERLGDGSSLIRARPGMPWQRGARPDTYFEKQYASNCLYVTGLHATAASHGTLPFRYHDRRAHFPVLLRLDATLARDPRLHVLGQQRAARASPADHPQAGVQHRRTHRHRHRLHALAGPVLPWKSAHAALVHVANYWLKLKFRYEERECLNKNAWAKLGCEYRTRDDFMNEREQRLNGKFVLDSWRVARDA